MPFSMRFNPLFCGFASLNRLKFATKKSRAEATVERRQRGLAAFRVSGYFPGDSVGTGEKDFHVAAVSADLRDGVSQHAP